MMQDKIEIAKLQKEKRRYESKGNLKEVAASCNKIGDLLYRLGDFEEAIVEHEQELALCESLEDQLGSAVAHRRIGECCGEMGLYDRALSHQQRHLQLARDCNNILEQQRAHATIGRTHMLRAETCEPGSPEHERALDEAEQSFKHSLLVVESLKKTVTELEYCEMKTRLWLNFGLIYDCRGNIGKCAECFKRAIQTAEKHKLYEDLYRCQYNLAGIYQRSNNLSQALRHADMAIKCSISMKDKLAERESLTLKGKIFLHLGDISAAKKTLKKAYKMALGIQEADQESLAGLLKNAVKMGRMLEELQLIYADVNQSSTDISHQTMKLYEKLGDTASKMECYQMALDNYINQEKIAIELCLDQKEMVPIFVSIAQTNNDLKNYQEAIKYFKKELDCRKDEPEQECKTWLGIGEAQDLDGANYKTIRKSYARALSLAQSIQNGRLQVTVMDSLRAVQSKHGDKEGYEVTSQELERLFKKYGIDPNDDLQAAEGSQNLDDDENDTNGVDFDIDDISDGSDVCSETEDKDAKKRGSFLKVKKNEKGESPLHRACIEGNFRKVKSLIESGHPVNPRDYCGWLPLHEAANHGFVDIVQYLLENGARIDDRGGEHCNGVTPLHDACSCGNGAVVKVLVKHGANVFAKDNSGKTPLDTLLDYYNQSKEELSSDEIEQFKLVENLLKHRMRAVNPLASYSAKGSKRINSPMLDTAQEVRKLGRFRRKHLSSRQNQAQYSDVEPDSEDDITVVVDTSRLPSVSQKSTNHSVSHMDGNENGSNPYFPRRQIEDIEMLHNPATATMAYNETMKNLKRSNICPESSNEVNSAVHLQPALIKETEFVGDNWLIDDVRAVKRKRSDPDGSAINQRVVNTKKVRQKSLNAVPSRKTQRQDRFSSRTTASEDECDTFDRSGENEKISHHESPKGTYVSSMRSVMFSDHEDDDCVINEFVSQYSNNTAVAVRKKKTQLTLASFGTINSHQNLKQTGSSVSGSAMLLDSSRSVEVAPTPVNANLNPLKMRLKVHIGENLILVPVLQSDVNQSVSWLAEQAADRYNQIYSIRPIGLTMALQDGAKLAPNDLISSTFLDNEELYGSVEKWELPSISAHYSEFCSQLKCTMYGNIKQLMQTAERTCCLQLKNLVLRPQHFLPIVRALRLQTSLKELDLEGNRLGNEGFSILIPALSTLPNLEVLNFGSNGLTDVSISKLAAALDESSASNRILQLLEKLVLSFNSFGDTCCLSLSRCIMKLPRLHHLLLASCDLSIKFFEHNRAALAESFQVCTSLQSLDVSSNKFGSTGVEVLLRSLNFSRLLSINLSNTFERALNYHTMKHLCHHLSNETCRLEELFLESCHLNSDNVQDICRLLRGCKSLKHVSLSGNSDLNAACLGEILTSGCCSCNDSRTSFELEFVECGLVSPLDSSFLDALNDRLRQQQQPMEARTQLTCLRLTVAKLCALDVDSLREIWTCHWRERSIVSVSGDRVLLSVMDNYDL